MKEFELKGTVKIATYPFRDFYSFGARIMFYNELGEQFVLCVDLNQNCCEDFNFNFDEYEEDELVSTNGIKITLTEDEEFECVCDCGGAIDIDITGNKKSYKCRVSNDHNGYYAHSVELMHDDEYVWEKWV